MLAILSFVLWIKMLNIKTLRNNVSKLSGVRLSWSHVRLSWRHVSSTLVVRYELCTSVKTKLCCKNCDISRRLFSHLKTLSVEIYKIFEVLFEALLLFNTGLSGMDVPSATGTNYGLRTISSVDSGVMLTLTSCSEGGTQSRSRSFGSWTGATSKFMWCGKPTIWIWIYVNQTQHSIVDLSQLDFLIFNFSTSDHSAM